MSIEARLLGPASASRPPRPVIEQDLAAVRVDLITTIGTYLQMLRTSQGATGPDQRELIGPVHDTTWTLSLYVDAVSRRYPENPQVDAIYQIARVLHASTRALWLLAAKDRVTCEVGLDAESLGAVLHQLGLYDQLAETWQLAARTPLPAWPHWPTDSTAIRADLEAA